MTAKKISVPEPSALWAVCSIPGPAQPALSWNSARYHCWRRMAAHWLWFRCKVAMEGGDRMAAKPRTCARGNVWNRTGTTYPTRPWPRWRWSTLETSPVKGEYRRHARRNGVEFVLRSVEGQPE